MTTFTFVLRAPARVVFTVNQLAPACRGEGHFVVKGRAGLNRVRFAGRIHGRQLGPGTYRISARTVSGRVVARTILVIVSGSAPSRDELAAARAANTCHADGASATGAASSDSGATSSSSSSGSSGGAGVATPLPAPAAQQPAGSGMPAPRVGSGVLASAVEKTAEAVRPLFVALLVAAILLLGIASVPQAALAGPRVNDVLARHRLEIASVGAAALVGTVLAFVLA